MDPMGGPGACGALARRDPVLAGAGGRPGGWRSAGHRREKGCMGPMGEPRAFGDLLRRHRVLAGMSQEELAERARLSARAISDLERGVKRMPRRDTVQLLVEALGLSGETRTAFVTAAREPAARRAPRHAGRPHAAAHAAI